MQNKIRKEIRICERPKEPYRVYQESECLLFDISLRWSYKVAGLEHISSRVSVGPEKTCGKLTEREGARRGSQQHVRRGVVRACWVAGQVLRHLISGQAQLGSRTTLGVTRAFDPRRYRLLLSRVDT